MNEVWMKMAEFLGRLNGENVGRKSYVRTPEYEKALEVWKSKEQSGICGLCAGVVPYGDYKRNRRTAMDG